MAVCFAYCATCAQPMAPPPHALTVSCLPSSLHRFDSHQRVTTTTTSLLPGLPALRLHPSRHHWRLDSNSRRGCECVYTTLKTSHKDAVLHACVLRLRSGDCVWGWGGGGVVLTRLWVHPAFGFGVERREPERRLTEEESPWGLDSPASVPSRVTPTTVSVNFEEPRKLVVSLCASLVDNKRVNWIGLSCRHVDDKIYYKKLKAFCTKNQNQNECG